MNKLREYAAVCAVGSAGYSLIEILWRGFTHWSMTLAGGVGFLLLYLTEWRMNGRLLLARCAAGCAVLTSVELAAGVVVNKLLGLRVWDYSRQKGNLWGQICPLYTILWFLLCVAVMPLAKRIRTRLAPAPYSAELS